MVEMRGLKNLKEISRSGADAVESGRQQLIRQIEKWKVKIQAFLAIALLGIIGARSSMVPAQAVELLGDNSAKSQEGVDLQIELGLGNEQEDIQLLVPEFTASLIKENQKDVITNYLFNPVKTGDETYAVDPTLIEYFSIDQLKNMGSWQSRLEADGFGDSVLTLQEPHSGREIQIALDEKGTVLGILDSDAHVVGDGMRQEAVDDISKNNENEKLQQILYLAFNRRDELIDGVRYLGVIPKLNNTQEEIASVFNIPIEDLHLTSLPSRDDILLVGKLEQSKLAEDSYQYGKRNLTVVDGEGNLVDWEQMLANDDKREYSIYQTEWPLEKYASVADLQKLRDAYVVMREYDTTTALEVEKVTGAKRMTVYYDPETWNQYGLNEENVVLPFLGEGLTYEQWLDTNSARYDKNRDLWEQRVFSAMMGYTRGRETDYIIEGNEVINVKLNPNLPNYRLRLSHNYVGVNGASVFVDANNGNWVLGSDGKSFVSVDDVVPAIDFFGKYRAATIDGINLQTKGYPLIERLGVIYCVTPAGLELVGGKYEIQRLQVTRDNLVGGIINRLGISASSELKINAERENGDSLLGKMYRVVAARSKDRLVWGNSGIVDVATQQEYKLSAGTGGWMVEEGTGRLLFENSDGIWNYFANGQWHAVDKDHIVKWTHYRDQLKLVKAQIKQVQIGRILPQTNFVDLQLITATGMPIYSRDEGGVEIGYYYDPEGMKRYGAVEQLMQLGMVMGKTSSGEVVAFAPSLEKTSSTDTLFPILARPLFRIDQILKPGINAASQAFDEFDKAGSEGVLLSDDSPEIVALPPELWIGLLIMEDKELLQNGVGENDALPFRSKDLIRIFSSYLRSGRLIGASGLATQDVKLADGAYYDRDLLRKLKEVSIGAEILRRHGPIPIIETYLASAQYGGDSPGIESGAKKIFGKDIYELSDAEIMLLLVYPNSPSLINPYTNNGSEYWANMAIGLAERMVAEGVWDQDKLPLLSQQIYEIALPSGSDADIVALERTLGDKVTRGMLLNYAYMYHQIPFNERWVDVESEAITNAPEYKPGYLENKGVLANADKLIVPRAKDVKYLDFVSFVLNRAGVDKVLVSDLSLEYRRGTGPDSTDYSWHNVVPVSGRGITVGGSENQTISTDPLLFRLYQLIGNNKATAWHLVANGASNGRIYAELGSGGLRINPGLVVMSGEKSVMITKSLFDKNSGIVFPRGIDPDKLWIDPAGNFYTYEFDNNSAKYVGTLVGANGNQFLVMAENYESYQRFEGGSADATLHIFEVSQGFRQGSEKKLFEKAKIDDNPNNGLSSYGVNPQYIAKELMASGVAADPIELMSNTRSKEVFWESVVKKNADTQKLYVWLSSGRELREIQNNSGESSLEMVSEDDRAVLLLGTMEDPEGNEYVALLDPIFGLVVNEKSVFLGSLANNGTDRIKAVYLSEKPLSGLDALRVNPSSIEYQVGLRATQTNWRYDIEQPGEWERDTTIEPEMQYAAIKAGRDYLAKYGGRQFNAIAIDQDGDVVLAVTLDANGNVMPVRETMQVNYKPGSMIKSVILPSAFKLVPGYSPTTLYPAGIYYRLKDENGPLVFDGLNSRMAAQRAIQGSNNGYFAWLVSQMKDAEGREGFGALKEVLATMGMNDTMLSPSAPLYVGSIYGEGEAGLELNQVSWQAIGIGPGRVGLGFAAIFHNLMLSDSGIYGLNMAQGGYSRYVGPLPLNIEKMAEYRALMGSVANSPGGSAYLAVSPIRKYPDLEIIGAKTGSVPTWINLNKLTTTGMPSGNFVITMKHKDGRALTVMVGVLEGGEGHQVAATVNPIALGYFEGSSKSQYITDLNAGLVKLVVNEGGEMVEQNFTDVMRGAAELKMWTINGQNNSKVIQIGKDLSLNLNEFASRYDLASADSEDFAAYTREALSSVLGSYAEGEIVASGRVQAAVRRLGDFYGLKNGDDEVMLMQCVSHVVLIRSIWYELANSGEIVPVDIGGYIGSAGDIANYLTTERNKAGMPEFSGNISDLNIADTVFISYDPGAPLGEAQGHVFVVMDKFEKDGKSYVVISHANKGWNGVKVVENGMGTILELDQETFDKLMQTQGAQIEILPGMKMK